MSRSDRQKDGAAPDLFRRSENSITDLKILMVPQYSIRCEHETRARQDNDTIILKISDQ